MRRDQVVPPSGGESFVRDVVVHPGAVGVVALDAELTRARLALVQAVGIVIGSGLKVFGVTPVEAKLGDAALQLYVRRIA